MNYKKLGRKVIKENKKMLRLMKSINQSNKALMGFETYNIRVQEDYIEFLRYVKQFNKDKFKKVKGV